MKKVVKYMIVLFISAMAVLAVGCGAKKEKKAEDTGAVSIYLRDASRIEEVLKDRFPDIRFDFVYYDGINTTAEQQMRLANHDITDIFMGTLRLSKEDSEENLLDLSGYEFCDDYENSILSQYDINGSIYQIPNSVTMRCIIYNKKMFEEHGWKEPMTFGELTALCRQIRRETDDITPIVFGGATNGYYFTTMTTYAQTEFLYTPEGAKWEEEYMRGEAGAEKGFETGIRMTQELIDAGAFDADKNAGCWDTEIFKKRMETGEAAMQFAWGGQNKLFGFLNGREKEYAVMPFRNYAGDAFLGTVVTYNIGLSKKLAEPGNEKKLKNALRVMEWFSTEDGQDSLAAVGGSVIYPVRKAVNRQTIPQFRELWNASLDGIKAPMLYMGYEDIFGQVSDYIFEAVRGEHTLDGLVEMIDEIHMANLKEDKDNAAIYAGSFASDLTHEQTVQLAVQMLHERGGSDITLVSDGWRTGPVKNEPGVHARFYEGMFLREWSNAVLPGAYDIEKPVIQMTLNGAQIKELLEKGKTVYEIVNEKRETSVYPYFWAGMTVQWDSGKAVSMTLADGRTVEKEQNYTVSFAPGDYMQETADAGSPKELEYSVMDVFSEYMEKNSPVKPVKVQRRE